MELTPEQEKFCQLKAKYGNEKKSKEIYKEVYGCSDASAYKLSYNLMRSIPIVSRIEEIQAELFRGAKVNFSKERFLRELVSGLELAKEKQNLLGMAQFLDRISSFLGYDIPAIEARQENVIEIEGKKVKTYEEFCECAGYPPPFKTQLEWLDIVQDSEQVPRMILGARGYGKTDYITICDVAYLSYINHNHKTLIMTRSQSRNSAIIKEIAGALEKNGVELDRSNTKYLVIKGSEGKDYTVEVMTLKMTLRGRHPDLIIMDDPVTEESVSSADRELASLKYDEAYKLTKNIVIIGQPAHQLDLYADKKPLIKTYEYPHGTIKELDADLELMKLAGVDENSIEMSYHLKVPKASDQAFAGVELIDEFPDQDSIAFIDPSYEGGDYTALTCLTGHFANVAIQGHVYKKAWYDCFNDIVQVLKVRKVRRLCIETNSLGEQPLVLMRKLIKELGFDCGVVGRKTTTNKHAKIMNAGTYVDKIKLSKTSDKEYIKQVTQYTYKAKHDDAPDSLASCMLWAKIIRE